MIFYQMEPLFVFYKVMEVKLYQEGKVQKRVHLYDSIYMMFQKNRTQQT